MPRGYNDTLTYRCSCFADFIGIAVSIHQIGMNVIVSGPFRRSENSPVLPECLLK